MKTAGLVVAVTLITEAYDQLLIKCHCWPSIHSTVLASVSSTLTIDLGCLAHISYHLHLRNIVWTHYLAQVRCLLRS